MSVARFVKSRKGREDGVASVYELDFPVKYGDDDKTTSFVWVSAVPHVGFVEGPETYIFACDSDGEVLDWIELGGSFKGAMDHDRALRGLGVEKIIR